MREIRRPVERVYVPAKFGVVIFAEAFLGGNRVRGEIFCEAVHDCLFAAFVRLGDEVNVAFVFDFRRLRVFFAENFSGFASGFECYFEIGFQVFRQTRLPRKEF